MTALAPKTATRFAPTTYAAFKVDHDTQRTYPLGDIGAPSTIAEALRAALTEGDAIYHKDTLVIRETGEDGDRLHVYVIRRKARQWVRGDFGLGGKWVQDLYADPVCSIDFAAVAGVGR